METSRLTEDELQAFEFANDMTKILFGDPNDEYIDRLISLVSEVRSSRHIIESARTVVERHAQRPCADGGKNCSICELALVLR